jgi:hypothetical protein
MPSQNGAGRLIVYNAWVRLKKGNKMTKELPTIDA